MSGQRWGEGPRRATVLPSRGDHVQIHMCWAAKRANTWRQLGKGKWQSRAHSRLNVAVCARQLCRGSTQLEGFLEEVAIEQKLNGQKELATQKIWGKSISGWGQE